MFANDAANGLPPHEITLADLLKEEGYDTKIVGKWHLGHRDEYLPTAGGGFDEWFGIPYHMSGGSVDEHLCGSNGDATNSWLPLYEGTDIVEQPVRLSGLGPRYAEEAREFVRRDRASGGDRGGGREGAGGSERERRPFFLYLAFSHVHQLCSPRVSECQWASSHFSKNGYHAPFSGAVREMDWIAGEVLQALRDEGIEDDTLVLFTSDNGPWVAESSCSGSKGKFEGRWLRDNVDPECTACPSEYEPRPAPGRPRRCVYPIAGGGGETMNRNEEDSYEEHYEVDGVPCGEDSGLGSAWEANVRVPAAVRWPNGGIPEGVETSRLVTTLDVVPTIMSLLGRDEILEEVDGVDVSSMLFGAKARSAAADASDDGNDARANGDGLDDERPIFFWRDGFSSGPLPPPYGRFDVVAVKIGPIKAWLWTKSAHYNPDPEVHHDPPLLFDVRSDPAEAFPLDPADHAEIIDRALQAVRDHKKGVDWAEPLALARDPKYLPCYDESSGCRTPEAQEEGGGFRNETLMKGEGAVMATMTAR